MKRRSMDLGTIGGLLLVCIFAVAMFMTLASGALVYKDISNVMEEQYTVRTAVSYLTTRVRQGNAVGSIELGEFDGCEALIIYDSLGDYATYIYCWNGYIREIYCPVGAPMAVTDGDTIIPADEVSFAMENDLLLIDCVTDGGSATQYVYVAGGGAAL